MTRTLYAHMNKRKRKIISRAKRTGVTAQAVELLPRKHRALSSNSSKRKNSLDASFAFVKCG
jgi:hypothetical protein